MTAFAPDAPTTTIAAAGTQPRVLHLVASASPEETNLDGSLDAVFAALASIGTTAPIACVGPWPGARERGRELGLNVVSSRRSPGGLPELSWRTLRREWSDRGLDTVHCWGVAAASLCRLALPGVPRLFTPLEPGLTDTWSPLGLLRLGAIRESAGVFFDDAERQRWGDVSDAVVCPLPMRASPVSRSDARHELGIADEELLIVPLADVESASRRAAATLLVGVLSVAGIPASILVRHGPHARRARTLASRPAFDMRQQPWEASLDRALAAADIAVAGPEIAGGDAVGSTGLMGVLVRSALASGVPCVVPEGVAPEGALPDELDMLRTRDASPMGLIQRIERHLLDADRRRSRGEAGRVAASADDTAFADALCDATLRVIGRTRA